MATTQWSPTAVSPPLTVSSEVIDGRYGEVETILALATAQGSGAGSTVSPGPGISLIDDPIDWLRETDFPQIQNLGNANLFPQYEYKYLPTTIASNTYSQSNNTYFTLNNGANGVFNSSLTPTLPALPVYGAVWSKRSGYGSPPDLDGDGMLALDLRGQPLYIDYPANYGASQGIGGLAGDAGWGEGESVDDAYELDLSLNARSAGYSSTSSSLYPNFSNVLAHAGRTTP